MTSAVFSRISKNLIDTLKTANRSHAIILTGPKGIGLTTAAKQIAGKQLSSHIQPKNKKGELDETAGIISVDLIREIYEHARSKNVDSRVIIISDADTMTVSAQNAFLKLLEEPNQWTSFILTSHRPEKLLPTVHSRLEAHALAPIDVDQSSELLDKLGVFDEQKRRQMLFIAAGLPAEITHLASSEEYFQQKSSLMSDARIFLQSSAYQRLSIAGKYVADRSKSLELLEAIMLLIQRQIQFSADDNYVDLLNRALVAHQKITINCNQRLQLTRIVL